MDMDVLARKWVEDTELKIANSEALARVSAFTVDREHARLWQFINSANRLEMSDIVVANLAAGPLENLLAYFGAEYIDRVEEASRRSPQFRHLLGGGWQSGMPEKIWVRVSAARVDAW